MTLHPISVVDHVLYEYRSYLRTEFQARDPKLRKALEGDGARCRARPSIEAFTRKHDPYHDIPLNEDLSQPIITLPGLADLDGGGGGRYRPPNDVLFTVGAPTVKTPMKNSVLPPILKRSMACSRERRAQ